MNKINRNKLKLERIVDHLRENRKIYKRRSEATHKHRQKENENHQDKRTRNE